MSEINECITCNKPLGQESKDLGFPYCHDCRRCAKCQLPISAAEAKYCHEQKIPATHARCLKHSDSASPEATIWLLNLQRLTVECPKHIEHMSFDEKYDLLKDMQNMTAVISISLNRDKQAKSAKDNQVKWERDKKSAAKDASTSSRPVGKSADAEDEKKIAWFMSDYSITERSIAIKELKLRDKAIDALKNNGVAYETAVEIVRQQLDKRFKPSKGIQ